MEIPGQIYLVNDKGVTVCLYLTDEYVTVERWTIEEVVTFRQRFYAHVESFQLEGFETDIPGYIPSEVNEILNLVDEFTDYHLNVCSYLFDSAGGYIVEYRDPACVHERLIIALEFVDSKEYTLLHYLESGRIVANKIPVRGNLWELVLNIRSYT